MPTDSPVLLDRRGMNSFLHVGLQDAKRRFVTLERQMKRMQQALRGVEVHHQPLAHVDRLVIPAKRMRIERDVKDQLFWRASHSAKIGVGGLSLAQIQLRS